MELNDTEKRLEFRTLAKTKFELLDELYLTATHGEHIEERNPARDLMFKIWGLSPQECMELVQNTKETYRLPEQHKRSVSERIAEIRQQHGQEASPQMEFEIQPKNQTR